MSRSRARNASQSSSLRRGFWKPPARRSSNYGWSTHFAGRRISRTDIDDGTLEPESAQLRRSKVAMTARRITPDDLARLRRQPEPPFVLGILQFWRITTADQFQQDPKTTPCWTGSMGELLPVLQQEIRQREIRGRKPLLYGLKEVQPAVRQALAEQGFAVDAAKRLVRLAQRATPEVEAEP